MPEHQPGERRGEQAGFRHARALSLRRGAPLFVVVVGGLFLGFWGPPQPDTDPSVDPRPAERTPDSTAAVRAPSPPPAPLPTYEPVDADAFAADVARLKADCQLPAQHRCDDQGCAVLLTMPDLERPEGWATLVLQSPQFVATVVLRDLGVPPTALDCVARVAALGPTPIRAVELNDGPEVWCRGADHLCNALAVDAVGERAARFDETGLRELRLAP